MSGRISDERLRNTRAWAAARVGSLSGADVVVAAIDEALASRALVTELRALADGIRGFVGMYGHVHRNLVTHLARLDSLLAAHDTQQAEGKAE